jgi:hypothetical protein
VTTPAKEPITAEVTITEWGRAEVLFREPGITGEILRRGVQSYIAFADERVGTGARYESAVRSLAAHLGLRRRHVVHVEIIDDVTRKAKSQAKQEPSLDEYCPTG